MKALSLKPPWAYWVRDKKKTIETRTWKTKYRGRVLICVSLAEDKTATWVGQTNGWKPQREPRGVAIALVTITDCRPMTKADESAAMCPSEPGRFAWTLEDIIPIKPVPIIGMLGLFRVPFEPADFEPIDLSFEPIDLSMGIVK